MPSATSALRRRLKALTLALVVATTLALGGAVVPVGTAGAAQAATTTANGACSNRTSFYAMLEMGKLVSMLPLGGIFNLVASLGKIALYGKCTVNSQSQVIVQYMTDQMQKVASDTVDQAKLNDVNNRTAGLIDSLNQHLPSDLLDDLQQDPDDQQALQEDVEALTADDRSQLAGQMDSIGLVASQLELELKDLSWQSLPAAIVIGGIKNGAYALEAKLVQPGQVKKALENKTIPDQLAQTREILAKEDADFETFVTSQLTLHREAASEREGTFGTQRLQHIWAYATDATGATVYDQYWSCLKKLPSQCGSYDSRRAQFFGEADAAHQKARADIAKTLVDLATGDQELDYLKYKATLESYGGLPFMLINNRSIPDSTYTAANETYRCLGALGDGAATATVPSGELESCRFSDANEAATDQVWRFVPGTGGELENLKYHQCLDVKGTPAQQIDGSPVVLGPCATPGTTPAADQQWVIHPLGYLVNLASGRCLDMVGAATTAVGAAAQVGSCEYGRSPMASHNSVEGIGSSAGVDDDDPATDQSWSIGYVGLRSGPLGDRAVGRDNKLAATPPPAGFTGPAWWAAPSPAGAPTAVSGTVSADRTSVDLSWSAPAETGTPALTGYRVTVLDQGTYGGDGSEAAEPQTLSFDSTDTHQSITGLTPRHTYLFQVSGFAQTDTDLLNGASSDPSSRISTVTVPSSPNGLSAIAGNGKVDLAWDPPTDNGGLPRSNYFVYRSDAPEGPWTLLTPEAGDPPTGESFTDSTAVNGHAYYYAVTAANAFGESVRSDPTAAVTPRAADQHVHLSAPHVVSYAQTSVPITAASDAGGAVDLSASPAQVCTVSGTRLVIHAAGTCTVRGSQAGDAGHNPASASLAVKIHPVPLRITAADASAPAKGRLPKVAPLFSGFVRGDTVFSLDRRPSCRAVRGRVKKVKRHGKKVRIAKAGRTVCTGARDANYQVSYRSGRLAVAKNGYAVTSPSRVYLRAGVRASVRLSAVGKKHTFEVKGSLPAGLRLRHNKKWTAVSVIGSPTARGSKTVTIVVRSGRHARARQKLTVESH